MPVLSCSSTPAYRALQKARADLIIEHPFFGTMALRLQLEEDPKCHDLWTNGQTLGFNPAWVSVQKSAALEAALAHEMLHLACRHHIRRAGRDAKLWNLACDYAVNLLLQEAGFTLPKGFIVEPKYAGLNADEIFTYLGQIPDEEPHGGAKKVSTSRRSQRYSQAGGSNASRSGFMQEAQSSQGSGEAKAIGLKSPKGSASVALGESADSSKDFFGEVRDHPSLSTVVGEGEGTAERDAELNLIFALQRALHAGDLPGHLERYFRDSIKPKLDWRGLLQRFLEMRVENDSTWTKPNRRYLYQGLYLPSRNEPTLERIVLVIDSSGSIDETKLSLFCAELSSILATYDTTITVLFHDSEVQEMLTFNRLDLPLELKPKGGGGTDYRPVTQWIWQEGLEPICVLWFTDLECSHFPPEPAYPVLWIISGAQDVTPPFGEWLYL